MTRRAWLVALLLALSCRRSPGLVESAEFGVFFGGQVQELKEIEKELDPARQRHGFRLTFRGALERDVPVAWEIAWPAPEKGGPRPALVGQTTAKRGERVLDVPLAFRPSDPLGVWHARVSADGRPVIDRDFTVVAAPPVRRSGALTPLGPRQPGAAASSSSTDARR